MSGCRNTFGRVIDYLRVSVTDRCNLNCVYCAPSERLLRKTEVRTLFIEPGSPWENGYSESFNGKPRDELLDRVIFFTLREAQVLIECWRQHYNTVRPHSALGYRPPAPEVRAIAVRVPRQLPALASGVGLN